MSRKPVLAAVALAVAVLSSTARAAPPPDPTAPNNDFITSLTIGWSYRR